MRVHVINLDRSPDRWSAFMGANGNLVEIARFAAVDGNELDLPQLVADGTITPNILTRYTRGALGCALSHLRLWRQVIHCREVRTIVEDDAILNGRFAAEATRVLEALPESWDIILWGWNFDGEFVLDPLPGISPCTVSFNQDDMRRGAPMFRDLPTAPLAYRLLRAFGIVCYSISPKGAAALVKFCTPLRDLATPSGGRWWWNYGIDGMLAAAYPGIEAFVSFPPLAITMNDRAASTIQGRSAPKLSP